MVRPVEGYRTADGAFFEDVDDAVIHECTYKLSDGLAAFVLGLDATITPEAREGLIVFGLRFIGENSETVEKYLNAHRNKFNRSVIGVGEGTDASEKTS